MPKPTHYLGSRTACPFCDRIFFGARCTVSKLIEMHTKASHGVQMKASTIIKPNISGGRDVNATRNKCIAAVKEDAMTDAKAFARAIFID
jgi:hypothetical protein